MFTSTADSLIPGALGGYRPPPDPLDTIMLFDKPMRWWQKKGLLDKALVILHEHERMVRRRLDEHHEECAVCLDNALTCPERRRLRKELD